jgi:hypothetical protein
VKHKLVVTGSVALLVALVAISIFFGAPSFLQTPSLLQGSPLQGSPAPTATPLPVEIVDTDDFGATPTQGGAPLVVHFFSFNASATAWRWNFGDKATSTLQNPTHTYSATGTYGVTLIETSASGANTIRKDGLIVVGGAQVGSWVTVVDDEFNTAGLPSQWSTYSGSFGGNVANCASPSLVQVPGDGYLHLKMAYLAKGKCGSGWYTSGIQVNDKYGGVNQAVTVRFRVVPPRDADVVRSQRALPMRWVDDPNYQWYQGESDFCEGAWLDHCYTFLHYAPFSQTQAYQRQYEYQLNLTQWHTWRAEQVGHTVWVFIDNMTHPVVVYNGDATTVPLSSKRTVLQQMCPLYGCPPSSYAGEVLDVQVDWIVIQNYQP